MPERKRQFLKSEALEAVRAASRETDDAVRARRLQEGIDKYRQYLAFEENQSDDEAWAGMGGAYRRVPDLDQAIESYQTASHLNETSTYALVNLASLLAARRGTEDEAELQVCAAKARAMIQARIDANKADHWTWYDRATLELISGDTAKAIQTFGYAIELTPRNAKENFASVLSNLQFLRAHNPAIPGLADAISLVEKHA